MSQDNPSKMGILFPHMRTSSMTSTLKICSATYALPRMIFTDPRSTLKDHVDDRTVAFKSLFSFKLSIYFNYYVANTPEGTL